MPNMRPDRTGLAFVITVAMWVAQPNTPPRPEFAVTSVKPNNASCCVQGGVGEGKAGGRDITLKGLIATAYKVQEFTGCEWPDTRWFRSQPGSHPHRRWESDRKCGSAV